VINVATGIIMLIICFPLYYYHLLLPNSFKTSANSIISFKCPLCECKNVAILQPRDTDLTQKLFVINDD
jgi:hypothetical protein